MSTQNCKTCGMVCQYDHAGSMCMMGACLMGMCDSGYFDCNANPMDGCETNVSTDSNNCGVCAKMCTVPMTCVSGVCT